MNRHCFNSVHLSTACSKTLCSSGWPLPLLVMTPVACIVTLQLQGWLKQQLRLRCIVSLLRIILPNPPSHAGQPVPAHAAERTLLQFMLCCCCC
jgi:hypothetical protein